DGGQDDAAGAPPPLGPGPAMAGEVGRALLGGRRRAGRSTARGRAAGVPVGRYAVASDELPALGWPAGRFLKPVARRPRIERGQLHLVLERLVRVPQLAFELGGLPLQLGEMLASQAKDVVGVGAHCLTSGMCPVPGGSALLVIAV